MQASRLTNTKRFLQRMRVMTAVRAAKVGPCSTASETYNSTSGRYIQLGKKHLFSCASPMTYARAYNRV